MGRITLNHIIQEFDYIREGSDNEKMALSYINNHISYEGNRESIMNLYNNSLCNNSVLPLLQAPSARVLTKYLSIPENLFQTIENLWGADQNVILSSAQILTTGLSNEAPKYWNEILNEYFY